MQKVYRNRQWHWHYHHHGWCSLSFAVSEEHVMIIATYVCMIACKYNLTWKIRNGRWFSRKIELMEVDIDKKENTPKKSNKARLAAWTLPKKSRDVMAFISYAAFYRRLIPFFKSNH